MHVDWNNIKECFIRFEELSESKKERIFLFLRTELLRIHPMQTSKQKKEDVVQDVLSKVIDGSINLKIIDNPKAYLKRCLKHTSLNSQRKDKKNKPLNEDRYVSDSKNIYEQIDPIELKEDREKLNKILSLLPMKDSVAIKLKNAPSCITKEEKTWLSEHSGKTIVLIEKILYNEIQEELIALVYPSFIDFTSNEERRRHFENFRALVNRAYKKVQDRNGDL